MDYCAKCGHKLPENAIFCDSCGEKVVSEVIQFNRPSDVVIFSTKGSHLTYKYLNSGCWSTLKLYEDRFEVDAIIQLYSMTIPLENIIDVYSYNAFSVAFTRFAIKQKDGKEAYFLTKHRDEWVHKLKAVI